MSGQSNSWRPSDISRLRMLHPCLILTCLNSQGAVDLRKRALMFLEGAAGRAPTEKLMNEIQARDDEIRDMEWQINDLLAMQKAQSQDKQEKPKPQNGRT